MIKFLIKLLDEDICLMCRFKECYVDHRNSDGSPCVYTRCKKGHDIEHGNFIKDFQFHPELYPYETECKNFFPTLDLGRWLFIVFIIIMKLIITILYGAIMGIVMGIAWVYTILSTPVRKFNEWIDSMGERR